MRPIGRLAGFPASRRAKRRSENMSVAFTTACPDCGHTLAATANPDNPYDWDYEECICETRRQKTTKRK